MPKLAALGSQGASNAGLLLPRLQYTLGFCGHLVPRLPWWVFFWERKSPVCQALAERTLPMPQAACPSPSPPHEHLPPRGSLGSGWLRWSPGGTLSVTCFPAAVQLGGVVNCAKSLHPGLQNIFIMRNFKCHCVRMDSLSFLAQTL